jgi:hypothetical protein
MHKYVKIGKRNGKRKKKRVFSASWAGGGGGDLAQPSAGARARAGGVKGQLGHSARWRKAPNRASERVNGEAMERVAAGGDRVDSLVMGARKVLTSGAHLPERGQLRGSEGECS